MFNQAANEEPQPKSKKSLFLLFLALFVLILAGCLLKVTSSNQPANQGPETSNLTVPKDGYKGKILSTPEGSLFDNYFKTEKGEYGLEAAATPIIKKLNELKDKDLEVILWGEIRTDVHDYAGQQIIVSKIEVPQENFSLTWEIVNNQNLGISFQYPPNTKFEIAGNLIIFDDFKLEVLNNPKSLNFEDWLNLNFAESKDKPCQIATSTGLKVGDYETYKVGLGPKDKCQELGYFAISPDKQKVLKLILGPQPADDYQEIIRTVRFIKILSPDEVDINEAKKNGENGDGVKIPNPASVYCEEQAGKLEIRTDKKTQSQTGICIFADKSECEEWAFYRGECQKGDNK